MPPIIRHAAFGPKHPSLGGCGRRFEPPVTKSVVRHPDLSAPHVIGWRETVTAGHDRGIVYNSCV